MPPNFPLVLSLRLVPGLQNELSHCTANALPPRLPFLLRQEKIGYHPTFGFSFYTLLAITMLAACCGTALSHGFSQYPFDAPGNNYALFWK